MATLSFFGDATSHADNTTVSATQDNITPPASMAANDLVYVFVTGRRVAGVTTSVAVDGGQTWTEHEDFISSPAHFAVYTCVFNGTWSADPEFLVSGAANNYVSTMLVFRSDTAGTWAVDAVAALTSQTATTSAVFPGVTTTGYPAVAVSAVILTAGRTLSTITGTGWTFPSYTQIRDTGGTDNTISNAYILRNSAGGATGDGGATISLSTAYYNYTLSFVFTPASGGYSLTLAQGSYSDTGQTSGLLFGRIVTAAQGAYADTGQSVILSAGRVLAFSQGSLTDTGQSVGLRADRALPLAQGSYADTGQSAAMLFGRNIGIAQGAYADTGSAADLIYSGAAASTYTVAIGQGSYSLSGQQVGLRVTRTLSTVSGSYSDTGQPVGLAKGFTVSLAQGSYSDTGSSAQLVIARMLIGTAGSYAYTGYSALFGLAGTGTLESSISVTVMLNDEPTTVMLMDSTNTITLDGSTSVSI